jgi:hypothetical protein
MPIFEKCNLININLIRYLALLAAPLNLPKGETLCYPDFANESSMCPASKPGNEQTHALHAFSVIQAALLTFALIVRDEEA